MTLQNNKKHPSGAKDQSQKSTFRKLLSQLAQNTGQYPHQKPSAISQTHFQRIFQIKKFSNKLNFKNQIKFIIIKKEIWKPQDTDKNNPTTNSNKDMPRYLRPITK